jgi:hypothetical protein
VAPALQFPVQTLLIEKECIVKQLIMQVAKGQEIQAPRVKQAGGLVQESEAACKKGDMALSIRKAKETLGLLKKQPETRMTTLSFYRRVIDKTGQTDRETVKRGSAAVLQALRDRLMPAEAAQAAAAPPRSQGRLGGCVR